MKDNILSQLLIKCPFPEVFEDTETVEGCSFPEPRRKIGHIRADYDGWRWYNTVWPCHRVLATQEVCKEIDRVYDALTAPNAFKDLITLRKFCGEHIDACIAKENILMQVHQKFLFVRCIRRIRNVQTCFLKKMVILEK